MPTVSELVKPELLRNNLINVISTGSDNGKAWYIGKKFFIDFPKYKPNDVLLVTSHISIFHDNSFPDMIPRQSDMLSYITSSDIHMLTYNQLYQGLIGRNLDAKAWLNTTKVIIFDEFQTMYFRAHTYMNYSAIAKQIISKKLSPNVEMFLAFTSAPGIMKSSGPDLGQKLNWISNKAFIRHKAHDLICTRIDVIPKMLEYDLWGKTIILCLSLRDCLKLKKRIPNSAVLVGQNSSSKSMPHTREMERIKKYIAVNHRLPYTTYTDGEEHPLDVLITTCIPAEGMDFYKDSGILNVISCVGSDVFVTQIANRLSFDYECLIVANPPLNKRIFKSEPYVTETNADFEDFYWVESDKWADSLEPYVSARKENFDIWPNAHDSTRFGEYLEKTWLCKKDATEDECKSRMIWSGADKAQIIMTCPPSLYQTQC